MLCSEVTTHSFRRQQRSRFFDFGPPPSLHLRSRLSFGPPGHFSLSSTGRTRRSRHAPRPRSCQPGKFHTVQPRNSASAKTAMRYHRAFFVAHEALLRFRRGATYVRVRNKIVLEAFSGASLEKKQARGGHEQAKHGYMTRGRPE